MQVKAFARHGLAPEVLTPDAEALMRCAHARESEERYDFESGRVALMPFWRGVGHEPTTEGLSVGVTAEVVLRAGALTGWLGSKNGVSGAQEIAKNLIFRARELFEGLGNKEKQGEASIELGICYWREGAFNEARTFLTDALSKAEDVDRRGRACVWQAVVERCDGNNHAALSWLEQGAPAFVQSRNYGTRCKYHGEYAIVLKNLGISTERADFIDRSIEQYTESKIYAETAGDVRYCAIIENNIGFLYLQLKQYDDAKEHLIKSRRLFQSIKDVGAAAQVDESFARIYIENGKCNEALRLLRGCIGVFENNDSKSLLAEALITRSAALIKLNRHAEAQGDLERAASVGRLAGDVKNVSDALLCLIEEFPDLSFEQRAGWYFEADQLLSKSQEAALLKRLKTCARLLLAERPSRSGTHAELPLKVVRRELEGQLVWEAMKASRGNMSAAARRLGITPQGMKDKLKKYPAAQKLQARVHAKAKGESTSPARESNIVPFTPRKRHATQAVLYRVGDESFRARGVHAGDRLVINKLATVEDGEIVVVKYGMARVCAGYHFTQGGIIRISTDYPDKFWEFSVKDFEDGTAELVGVAEAKIAAEQVKAKRPKIEPV